MSGERRGGMRLIEECAGVGEITWQGGVVRGVRYDVKRFQGFAPSGLPVPGLHRLEGRVDLAGADMPGAEAGDALVRSTFTLRLDDGRTMRLTCVDSDGRVLAEGHGPSQCGCC